MTESESSTTPLTVRKALLAGWLIVNVPAIVIMLAVLLIGMAFPQARFLFLAIALLLGWIWWSFMVPRWRRWALNRGVPADKLQRWAVITGLVWRKGSLFEKTEIDIDR